MIAAPPCAMVSFTRKLDPPEHLFTGFCPVISPVSRDRGDDTCMNWMMRVLAPLFCPLRLHSSRSACMPDSRPIEHPSSDNCHTRANPSLDLFTRGPGTSGPIIVGARLATIWSSSLPVFKNASIGLRALPQSSRRSVPWAPGQSATRDTQIVTLF
jgi:hypothetical protein